MDHNEFPELEPKEELTEAVSNPEAPAAEQTGFVDFFADILPNQPVSAPASPDMTDVIPENTAEELTDVPQEPADDLILEIQSVVEHAIAETIPQEPEEEIPTNEEAEEDTDLQEELNFTEALDPVEEAPADAQPEDDAEAASFQERVLRKGRPRRKRGEFLFGLPQMAVTAVWLAIILLAGTTLGRMLWVCAADVLAFGREDKVVTITVYESDTIDQITEKLHRSGLIRYPGLFRIYADLAVDDGEIQPGIWDLNTMYDYHALVNMMSASSSREVVENVLIPEGYTCRQIFELLESKRVCTAKDLAEYAASGELDAYWFLENVERGSEYCLEGFLFPDTYDFYKNSSPRDVLEKLLSNFDYRFTEEMRAQMDVLNANITGGTFDIHDVVIVASMIEKETASNSESPMIASVIYNRLFNWGGTPAYLNIDASIVYALDGKTDLTAEDLKIDSPYNTYTHTGLTPGAISNPGLASLKAALSPAATNYYFYVLNPAEGLHKFSTTLDEHNAFIATLE